MTENESGHLFAVTSRLSMKRAFGIACATVYGPFAAMAIYTLFFVSCSHCKFTAWILLPWAPGLVATEFGRRALSLSRPDDGVTFTFAFIIAILVVAALAFVIRHGKWAARAGVVLALSVFSVCAFAILSMIRA